MSFDFLFWLFLFGILIATIQDFKRREIDNWLNLFLIFSSFAFVLFKSVINKNVEGIFLFAFILIVMFFLANLFYYERVFAGGDAKLLFAMSAFFMGAGFFDSLWNVGFFLFFLMISGSVYGLFYIGVLYIKNFSKANSEMKKIFSVWWVKYLILAGVVLFVFSYVDWFFLFFSVVAFVLALVFVFARGLENVSMVRSVSGKELREGDWLFEDVKVGRKVIKAKWDGLSLEEIKMMRKLKKVKIKEGIPFTPAFLIAFLAYYFFRGLLSGVIMGLV